MHGKLLDIETDQKTARNDLQEVDSCGTGKMEDNPPSSVTVCTESKVQQRFSSQLKLVPELLKPYFNFRDELTTLEGLVFKGEKVVVSRKEI